VISVFAAVAQLGAIYYVFDMNSTTKETYDELGVHQCEAPGSAYFLRLICLTVFVASVLVDLKESCCIVSYLSLIPTINKWTDADKKALHAGKKSLFTKRVVVANEKDRQFQIEAICCGGISSLERAWWWLWIVVKVVAELGCMVAGSGYVLYADSNENLILVSTTTNARNRRMARHSHALPPTEQRRAPLHHADRRHCLQLRGDGRVQGDARRPSGHRGNCQLHQPGAQSRTRPSTGPRSRALALDLLALRHHRHHVGRQLLSARRGN
jgi:hypothetical protein